MDRVSTVMTDRPTRWLAVVLVMLVAAHPLAARPMATPDEDGGRRDAVVARMIDAGDTPDEARRKASRLTPEDLAVLATNPLMIQPAGTMDVSTEMFIGTTLVVGIIVVLAVAGSTVIIVSP